MNATENKTAIKLLNYIENVLLENSQYRDLMFEFVTQQNLQDDFRKFLSESIRAEKYGFLDLEHIKMDYY